MDVKHKDGKSLKEETFEHFLRIQPVPCRYSSVHCHIDHWGARNRIEPSSTIKEEEDGQAGVYVIRAFEIPLSLLLGRRRRREFIFYFFGILLSAKKKKRGEKS